MESVETIDDYYELPPILLNVHGKKYSLFSSVDGCETLFDADYKPETIDIPLNEGDQYNMILFDSPVYYLILELKHLLNLGEVDVSFDVPQLSLTLHQDLPYMRKLTPYLLHNYFLHLSSCQGIADQDIGVLSIDLILHTNSLKKQLIFLSDISIQGGLPSNPIILEESDHEEEIDDDESHSIESNDELTEQTNPNNDSSVIVIDDTDVAPLLESLEENKELQIDDHDVTVVYEETKHNEDISVIPNNNPVEVDGAAIGEMLNEEEEKDELEDYEEVAQEDSAVGDDGEYEGDLQDSSVKAGTEEQLLHQEEQFEVVEEQQYIGDIESGIENIPPESNNDAKNTLDVIIEDVPSELVASHNESNGTEALELDSTIINTPECNGKREMDSSSPGPMKRIKV